MIGKLFLPLFTLFLVAFHGGIHADPQNNENEESLSNVEELPLLGSNSTNWVTCADLFHSAKVLIRKHPDWRQFLDQYRRNTTEFLDKCEEKLNNTDAVRSIIDYQKEMLECPTETHGKMTQIVAVVFIVAFLLAIIALVILSILYYRK